MKKTFYRAFEDRYRGSTKLITERLQVYLPFLHPLLALDDEHRAIDLGCGRGEWLGVLNEQGFNALGVDLDDGMLEQCRVEGYAVENGDAVAKLKSLADASHVLVSGFHIAEHVPFPVLQELVGQALRVLKPGGLLILETPNAENLMVGTNSFYLDPSHEKPIPNLLLSFLAEYEGFGRTKLLRLQELSPLPAREDIRLLSVLSGVSPDYAVIAQKEAPEHTLSAFACAFGTEYGVTLEGLAERYEERISTNFQEVGERVDSCSATLEQVKQELGEHQGGLSGLSQEVERYRAEMDRLKQVVDDLNSSLADAHQRFAEVDQRLAATEAWIKHKEANSVVGILKRTARPVAVKMIRSVLGNQLLRQNANQLLRKFPKLHHQLKLFAQHRGLIGGGVFAPSGTGHVGFQAVDYSRVSFAVYPKAPLLPEAYYLKDEAVTPTFGAARITGHIEGHYSLAIVNRGLGVALFDLLEGKLAFQPYHGKAYDNVIDIPAFQQRLMSAVGQRFDESLEGEVLSIVHHYPMIKDLQGSGMRLVIFFWEETAVPFDTISFINENFDGVIVAASFVKKVLHDSGCQVPVFICPVGVDHIITDGVAPITDVRPAAGQRFRFLHVSSMFERKGPDVLIEAFVEAFSSADNVELYIKTFPNPHNRVHEMIANLSAERQDMPSIVVDENPMDDQGIIALYRSAHTLVLPTRGEGFNLPAAEALAMGLPVIVTGFGAHVDFCTLGTAELLPFLFAKSGSHLGAANSCWVEPDKHTLALKMGELRGKIVEGDNALEQRRRQGIELVRSIYTWEQSAKAVLASANWLKHEMPAAVGSKTKLVVVSPWATKCGIAEYTQALLSEFKQDDYDIRIYCDERTTDTTSDVYQPVWKLSDAKSVGKVLANDGCADADVVLVQHQPSLFALNDEVCERLAQLHDQGKVVVLELHSTQPLITDHRLSERAVRALHKLDRIIVHKPEDLNNLLVLGLAANVMMMAHGVISPLTDVQPAAVRDELGIAQDDLVISCFGFILAHKGIDTLIETILPLAQETGRNVHMLGLHSILDARSEQTLDAYRARAVELGVGDKITWVTDFRPIKECLRLMSAADYVIFPYKETQESASGAVTIGITTLKPVLVSPIHIFSDMAEATWQMSGSHVADIVASIAELERSPDKAQALVGRQERWIDDRSWERVSARLDATVQALLFEKNHLAPIVEKHRRLSPGISSAAPKKLLVDVSELYFRDAKTGIQRVVKRIINEFQRGEGVDYQVIPVFGVTGKGYRVASGYPGSSAYVASLSECPIEYSAGDVFLGLDLSAHLFPEFDGELERMRRAGVSIHFVVYDLIPLLHSRFAYPGIDGAFSNWMRSISQYADGVVAISAAVAADVKVWLQQHGGGAVMPSISHFHLGADIEEAAQSQSSSSLEKAFLVQLGAVPTFLMVGTLEPRKGHQQILAAFDVLWAQGVEVNLVLVGKEGWAVEQLVQDLRAHPQLGKRLFWLQGLSDADLTELYSASCALIAASEAEGFGLPLIEAAQHKLPIIARDIPVFREVAGEYAFYFQGGLPDDLAQAMKQWLELFEKGAQPLSDEMPWLHWSESAAVLKRLVLGVAEETDEVKQKMLEQVQ
ncbi:glycosyltransferase [Pseudomonas asiatica]|uniref:glycosyltransferase n=1 Tax=Pseudomonas asiatica TaxID=2219225 RepID=UPI0018AB0F4A|nr:glycosyltransferase [Pseudomonas asiatica]